MRVKISLNPHLNKAIISSNQLHIIIHCFLVSICFLFCIIFNNPIMSKGKTPIIVSLHNKNFPFIFDFQGEGLH